MARQFIYHMYGLTKAYAGGRKVLEGINLSFYPDAKNIHEKGARMSQTHRLIAKVSEDYERWSYNTSVAACMEFSNLLRQGCDDADAYGFAVDSLLLLMAPMVPHVTAELWERRHPGETFWRKDGSPVPVEYTAAPVLAAPFDADPLAHRRSRLLENGRDVVPDELIPIKKRIAQCLDEVAVRIEGGSHVPAFNENWAEAMRLLAGVPFGRIVFTRHALPAVRPVNHLVVDGQIIIRSNPGTILSTHLAPTETVVAYEADELDGHERLGWSVIVTGVARLVTDPLAMTNLSKMDREFLREHVDFAPGQVVANQLSNDGTRKLFLRAGEGRWKGILSLDPGGTRIKRQFKVIDPRAEHAPHRDRWLRIETRVTVISCLRASSNNCGGNSFTPRWRTFFCASGSRRSHEVAEADRCLEIHSVFFSTNAIASRFDPRHGSVTRSVAPVGTAASKITWLLLPKRTALTVFHLRSSASRATSTFGSRRLRKFVSTTVSPTVSSPDVSTSTWRRCVVMTLGSTSDATASASWTGAAFGRFIGCVVS